MASSKSFITALLLALAFSSMSLSLGARHLLQTTTQPNLPAGIPTTLPNPTTLLPPLPSIIPTMPQGNGNVPQFPTIPSLPQPTTLPPLPSINNIPTTLQNIIPSIPTTIPTSIPSIPFFSPPPSTTSP